MKNSINRYVPDGFTPYVSSTQYKNNPKSSIKEKAISCGFKLLNSYDELFDQLNIKDGFTLSFHHHLRNGDYVLNSVISQIKKRDLKDLTLAPSSIFPNNRELCDLIINQNVTSIYTNYANGPVAETISKGYLINTSNTSLFSPFP